MNYLRNAIGHFKTITKHKLLVTKTCFKAGLYKQGLLHDLSKYTPTEFVAGIKYWQGDKSPNSIQKKVEGVSYAWLHHKGRNKHHFESIYGIIIDEELITKENFKNVECIKELLDRL